MSRSRLGPRKTKIIEALIELPVKEVFARGGTDHRLDIILKDGSVLGLFKDNSFAWAERDRGRR